MLKTSKNIIGSFCIFSVVFLGAFTLINTAKADSCKITTTLKLGSKGNDVKCLQTNLNILADGNFGQKTKLAFIAWQKSKGLTADGVFGSKSQTILFTNTSPIVSGNLSTGCTSTIGFNTMTGLPCSTNTVTQMIPASYSAKVFIHGGKRILTTINTTEISGVTIPVADGTPTATIADTSEYTATISWNGNPTTFTGNTSYTAIITLTPKTGHTLSRVPANFFTVAGATTTNSINSGVVSAVFPATALKQLTITDPISLTTSKPYDTNTTAVVTAGTLSGIISPDVVTVSAVANYNTSSVGTGKTITVVYTLSGAQAENYIKPVNYTTATGVITHAIINASSIAGVAAPISGAIPTATITATTQYTATISWNGNPSTFSVGTVYTATITITPKTGYILSGVPANFFTVAGATTTNSINSGVVSAVFPVVQDYAAVPSAVVLAVGSTAPVGGVTNVVIPAIGTTNTTGVITDWVANTADKIKFTVTDAGSATSTITINGSAYVSGTDYQVVPTTTLPTIVVTTTEAGKITTVITFIIAGPIIGSDGLTYGIAVGSDNKRWLDRNLGATRVATSFDDYQAYGSLFQWGRLADGHQLITHTTATDATAVYGSTTTLSSTDNPGTNLFIITEGLNYSWRNPSNNNLWQGVNGINNPCPTGFRLPTETEWGTLIADAGITNSAKAYSSSLRLTVGGLRYGSDALLYDLGTQGAYWSSDPGGNLANGYLFLVSEMATFFAPFSFGASVRCVKN